MFQSKRRGMSTSLSCPELENTFPNQGMNNTASCFASYTFFFPSMVLDLRKMNFGLSPIQMTLGSKSQESKYDDS